MDGTQGRRGNWWAGPSAASPRPEWLRGLRTPPWPLGGVLFWLRGCAGSTAGANKFPLHSLPCVRNGRVQRPVVPAWKHQRNTSDSRRNAAAWRERPKQNSTAGFWRKWRKPGRGSPRSQSQKAFTRWADHQAFARHCAAVPSAAIPAPFAAKTPALSGPGLRLPYPGTP